MPNLPSNPAPSDDSSDLHTTEELAAYLKVDPKTIYNWVRDGIIPEAMRIGRVVRFSLEDVKVSLDLNRAGEGMIWKNNKRDSKRFQEGDFEIIRKKKTFYVPN